MRKLIFISIALFSVLSCTKMESELKESKPIVFSASIDEAKTSVSAVDGKVQWIIGDVITISDGTNTGVYSVAGIDEHRFATFTYKSGTQFTAAGTYSATYGNVNDQWYSANDGSNCPMSAAGVSAVSGDDCKFTFTNDCGVVAVTANTGDIKIAKIMIGDKSLNFANPKALDGTYLVAVPAGEAFTSVTFVKADGSKASKTISSTSVEQNVKRGLNTGNYFSTATYSGFEPRLLPGAFTVGTDGHQVQFAAGNLYWDGTSYKFEDNQYDTRTSYDANHVTHFYKYYHGATVKPYVQTAYNGTYAFNKQESTKNKIEINYAVDGYRLLTVEEIEYLYDTSKVTENHNDDKNIKTIDGTAYKYCMLIYPDGYSGSKNESTWDAINNAGIVFLPVSGRRNGTSYTATTNYGYMMIGSSSVQWNPSTSFNYGLAAGKNTFNEGFIVRLVKDVK